MPKDESNAPKRNLAPLIIAAVAVFLVICAIVARSMANGTSDDATTSPSNLKATQTSSGSSGIVNDSGYGPPLTGGRDQGPDSGAKTPNGPDPTNTSGSSGTVGPDRTGSTGTSPNLGSDGSKTSAGGDPPYEGGTTANNYPPGMTG
jgi:hypothetical protein